jgi:hypothetical protein
MVLGEEGEQGQCTTRWIWSELLELSGGGCAMGEEKKQGRRWNWRKLLEESGSCCAMGEKEDARSAGAREAGGGAIAAEVIREAMAGSSQRWPR